MEESGIGGLRTEGPSGGDDDNGLRIIDDDLGREREAEESRTGMRQPTLVQRPEAAAEAFPALPASAAPRTYWGPGMRTAQPNAGGGQDLTGPSNILEQVQVQCACGRRTRRVQAPAVGEEAPPPLECDDECARHRRREQLAAAFGVEDASAVASEQAAQAFTPELLAMASRNVKWVEQVEGAFTDLIGSTAKRASLPAMPKAERGLVHDLAKHYRLATHSYGNEPKRHIDIFRVANSLIPPLRLSQVAKMHASTLQSAIKQQQQQPSGVGPGGAMLAAPQWRLQFSEVAPHVEVNQVLWEFQGQYTLEARGARSAGSSVAVFTEERIFRRAASALGAGVRGQFRVTVIPPTGTAPGLTSSRPTDMGDSSSTAAGNVERLQGRATSGDTWQVQMKPRGGRPVGREAEGLLPPPAPTPAPRQVQDAWDDEIVDLCREEVPEASTSEQPMLSRATAMLVKGEAPMTSKNTWELLHDDDAGDDDEAQSSHEEDEDEESEGVRADCNHPGMLKDTQERRQRITPDGEVAAGVPLPGTLVERVMWDEDDDEDCCAPIQPEGAAVGAVATESVRKDVDRPLAGAPVVTSQLDVCNARET